MGSDIGVTTSAGSQVVPQTGMEPRHSATVVTLPIGRYHFGTSYDRKLEPEESLMVWTTPTLVEICIGLEINGYLPAEF